MATKHNKEAAGGWRQDVKGRSRWRSANNRFGLFIEAPLYKRPTEQPNRSERSCRHRVRCRRPGRGGGHSSVAHEDGSIAAEWLATGRMHQRSSVRDAAGTNENKSPSLRGRTTNHRNATGEVVNTQMPPGPTIHRDKTDTPKHTNSHAPPNRNRKCQTFTRLYARLSRNTYDSGSFNPGVLIYTRSPSDYCWLRSGPLSEGMGCPDCGRFFACFGALGGAQGLDRVQLH